LHVIYVLQRFGGEIAGNQDTRALRDEMYELERQVAEYQRELNELGKQLTDEKRVGEEVKQFSCSIHFLICICFNAFNVEIHFKTTQELVVGWNW
jgi:hypothetical protein